MPKVDGDYFLVAFEGDLTQDGKLWEAKNTSTLSSVQANVDGTSYYKEQLFSVVDSTTSVEGAYAFEYNGTAADGGISDTAFNYNGEAIKVGFGVDTTMLVDANVNVTWTSIPAGAAEPTSNGDGTWNVIDAGSYTAKVTGKGAYSGNEDVTFEVKGIDLANDEIVIAPATELKTWAAKNISYPLISINGTSMTMNADFTNELIAVNGDATAVEASHVYNGIGAYTIRLTAKEGSKNVTGSTTVDAYVVTNPVSYAYNGTTIKADGSTVLTEFDAAKGTVFAPAAITATAGGKDVIEETSIVVTKDGEVVTSYDEPGEYVVTLSTPVASDYAYAGSASFKFTVKANDYSAAKFYISYDGKNLVENQTIPYTGKAVDPTVVVKLGDKTLVEGEDYTVSLKDADEAIESAVNPSDDYAIVITFNGKYNGEMNGSKEYGFAIDKAQIVSAKASADFFATDGETAAVPSFVGYTEADCEGIEFALASDEIAVTYREAKTSDQGKTYTEGDIVKAEDLNKAGMYYATINVLSTSDNLKGSGVKVLFKVAEKAAFSDVDANAWYAESVYTAASEGFEYMNGLAGTALFMPLANITRAEVAQVFYNMAGGPDFNWTNATFEDITAGAWYGQAVAWAAQSGVVTGYDNGEFGPNDSATREQVATMIYRYMKAQGKDVSVKDEAAALAKYADGASVSDWAKTAMAYCIEAGVFGVDTDTLRPQDNLSRAEMAATSVRVQPEGAYTEL